MNIQQVVVDFMLLVVSIDSSDIPSSYVTAYNVSKIRWFG